MDFNLSDEQRMLQESARRYMAKIYTFARREELLAQGGFSSAVWQELAEMGWLAAAIPEAFGGVGFGNVETTILSEELGRGLLLEPYLHGCLFPAALIQLCADETWQTELLPALATGEMRVAVAHSEPESRGEVSWVSTRAQRQVDGSFVLNGRKSVGVGAAHSDWLLVVARSAGECADRQGISLFAVRRGTPGVSLEPLRLLDGTPAAELLLNDVAVGAEGAAHAGLQRAVDEAIVHQCAETVGGMEDVLTLCAD